MKRTSKDKSRKPTLGPYTTVKPKVVWSPSDEEYTTLLNSWSRRRRPPFNTRTQMASRMSAHATRRRVRYAAGVSQLRSACRQLRPPLAARVSPARRRAAAALPLARPTLAPPPLHTLVSGVLGAILAARRCRCCRWWRCIAPPKCRLATV